MPGAVNYQSGGTIKVSRFVMANYPIDYQVITADGTQEILGISQEGTKAFPAPNSTDVAAASGDILAVYQDEANDEPLLYISASVTGGQLLKSDATGGGTPWSPTSTALQFVGAEARQSGVSGDFIRVRPRFLGGRAV